MELDAPGFDENELTLELSDHTLTVRGEKAEEKEEKDTTFYLRERLENRFERTFALPAEADAERIEATFKAWVLEVRVPKLEETRPRTITIET